MDPLLIMKELNFKVTYDKDTDAAYIYFTEIKDGAVSETLTVDDSSGRLSDDLNIDVDQEFKALGIEILYASEHLPEDLLAKLR